MTAVKSSAPDRAADRQRATSYDVARLAGVSQSAVSRCFSPGASISLPTRQKVEAAARTLGYSPDPLARSLITRRTGLVGLVVTTATLRYTPQLVHDLAGTCQSAGFVPLLTTLDDEKDLAAGWARLLDYRPEAIVTLASVTLTPARAADERGIPLIFVNRAAPRGVIATSIRCAHASATAALVADLAAAGHRRIAFIAGPSSAPVSRDRLLGYRQGLQRAGLESAGVMHADYSYEGGTDAARALLAYPSTPDALVCANDAMALGALDHCRLSAGLDVPRDISVTGFDDIPEAARPNRALTTVGQPTADMARIAVEALLRLRETGVADGRETLVEGALRWRATSRRPRAD